MADQKKGGIVWTDSTWSPIRGCSHVSPGCDNCYAERMAARFAAEGQPYFGVIDTDVCHGYGRWNGRIKLVEEHLTDPLRWRKPRRIFVNSMSDLFHPGVPDEWIDRIFAVMALAPQHTFQILTKRARGMMEYLTSSSLKERILMETAIPEQNLIWPLPNVWIGVTAENQATADERIPLLLQTPAALRFVSMEPMLGRINLGSWLTCEGDGLKMIDWVIVGGESGPGARPMLPDWARSVRNECQEAEVPFLFKQWGEWRLARLQDDPEKVEVKRFFEEGKEPKTGSDLKEKLVLNYQGAVMARVGKKAAGRLLDGCEWNQFPDTASGLPFAEK